MNFLSDSYTQKKFKFDGVGFVNGLLLIIFISLLLFGSTKLPDEPLISTTI